MSDHSSSDQGNNEHQHSAPSSPHVLSSPAECNISSNSSSDGQSQRSNSTAVFEFSGHSSPSYSRASPPSSPVKPGQKRPSYGAYKDDPTIPIPRQTLDRWKKLKAECQSSDSSDNTHSQNSSTDQDQSQHEESLANKNGSSCALDNERDDESHQPDNSEILDQTCNLSMSSSADQSNSESSDSGEDHHSNSDSEGDGGDSGDSEFRGSDDGNYVYEEYDPFEDGFNCEMDPFEDDSLYPGCEKTKDEAIFELINVYLCKKLTKSALTEILKIYITSLPPNNIMPSSVHYLFQYVRSLSLPLNEVEHYYCRPAKHSVTSKSSPCAICESDDIGVFFELPLENILKFLFEQRGLADLIDSYSEIRRQRGDSNICDVTDGSEYKRVWGGISSRYKITLILNTDGVRTHKSSKASFWPLMFSIMEIPPELRSSFTIVWGIWYDKKLKPNMNLFLKPFVSALVKIHRTGGISWKHPSTGEDHVSPVRAPLKVADAPARANILNMQEHQAKYACNTCEQKTNKLPAPAAVPGQKKKRRKRRFLFRENAATLRTHERMIACGNIGSTAVPKRGIKGPTVIRDIPFLDLSTCVIAEYMHSVLCGVVRQICSLWLFEKGPWYIGSHMNEMDIFLHEEIHVPDTVSRLPRSFEYFDLMKANEFRSYLLYFSLIITAPHLRDDYHQHWMLFVQAIFLLLKESISENDLLTAEALLRLFVRDLGTLYGNEQYVYNCHQLIHLCLYVRRWGCLWSNAAFYFEGMNGVLADMIHGSKNEGRELLNQLSLAQGNQMLKNKIDVDAKKKSGVSVLGKQLSYNFNEVELNHLKALNVNIECLECYGRVEVGREKFSSKVYDKHFKRRNSYVEAQCNGRKVYGRVLIFCKSVQTVFCILSVFKIDHTKFFYHKSTLTRIGHIIPVEEKGEYVVCEVKDIVQKVIQVGDFLCLRPNSIERNL